MLTVFKRYEKKFLIRPEDVDYVTRILMLYMIPDPNGREDGRYQVRNLYYDTPHSDIIRGSLKRPYYKEKFRIRSYGIPQSADSEIMLEMKKKFNGIVLKRRVRLSLGQAQEFMRSRKYPDPVDPHTAQILHEIEYYLSHAGVSPAYLITYERTAFCNKADNRFRITFDRDLRYCNENPNLFTCIARNEIIPHDMVLMEVKFSDSYPFWFADLMSQEKFYPHTFSKFGVAYKKTLRETFPHDQEIDVFGRF